MMDENTDYLSKAAAELDMYRAALSCLVEVASGCAKDAETMRVENMLYLLEGGLDRIGALLQQESKYRMAKKARAQA